MKNILKRLLSGALALVMVAGLLPVATFAAVDSTGKPTDLANKIILSVYIPDTDEFPGEPAVHSSDNYRSFNSSFQVANNPTFASRASTQLKEEILDNLVQGTPSGNTKVWGVYNVNGLEQYFREGASIIQQENEIKMIQAIKGCSAEEAKNYDIVWYVIKLQHEPGSGWFWSSDVTEWHIDGVIKEKSKISINYYGNGNTSGSAPDGIMNHTAGDPYTILDQNTMVKKINGVEVGFLGWSAKADGTGAEAGFYQPGDVINPKESISLYAMWDTFTQYTATVRTYLDDQLMSASDLHHGETVLSLSTDNVHFYDLTRVSEGTYTTKITGNGKFHLYHKNEDGSYTQKDDHQLTIYNQNGSLDIRHYSVTYDPNEGAFETENEKEVYLYGKSVTAREEVPTREGYRFLGWQTTGGKLLQPGDTITESITAPVTLTAMWEKTVNVTVNVTINHTDINNPNGYDRAPSKDNVFVSLVGRENDNSPYLEVDGKDLDLDMGTAPTDKKVTQYLGNVFTDMPGGEVDYTVVTSKSDYDTKVTATQDDEGNWVIDVVMDYNPSNLDLEFTVQVDDSVPDRYLPIAAIVKIICWSSTEGRWVTISQQNADLPGVRVNIDPKTRSGSGSYPVWTHKTDDTPYGYRIQVTSFVYPDGTIVRADKVVTEDVAWTDNVYTATASEVTGGKEFGTLNGAYFGNDGQEGKLNAVITMDLHDVTFDAQGGKVNGAEIQTVKDQYKVPGFKEYTPVREGGYIFDGWYEDQNCTVAATEGKDLTQDITLYAKWIEPLTISGTVTISGTYKQNDETVSVHDIDRATEVSVVLQEVRDNIVFDITSMTVDFGDYEDEGTANFAFTGIPNDGKNYQIRVLTLNYGTTYDNESDQNSEYTATEYTAVFDGDNVADVDVYLKFEAPAYDQILNVDTTQISEAFRPTGVLSEVLYRDTGDNHAFQRISQHGVTPFGVMIALDTGVGRGTQSIWKWHTNGTLYDYQMNITKLYGDVPGVFTEAGLAFNSDIEPYYIVYGDPVYWDASTNTPSGEMNATLIPKQYRVTFDLNADTDTVTGMDQYLSSTTGKYQTIHKWSYDTAITAVPQREGYVFAGWQADVANAYVDGKIPAAIYQEVVLTAQWERICYEVTTATTTGGSASGSGTYAEGATATVVATPKEGWIFKGWYENGTLVSQDASYSFTVDSNRKLTAHFAAYYTINTIAQTGGTVSGGGQYEANAKVTITATVEDGYYFVGWYNAKDELHTSNSSFELTVLQNETFTAKFVKKVAYKCDYVYIFGYNNTQIGAEGPLLRGELAQMIYRLVKQNEGSVSLGKVFDDTAGEWFEKGMAYMAAVGAIDDSKTNALPFASVSRGETYRMICLGLGFTTDTNLKFSEYAAILYNSGYLADDGRVTAKIQRWEFCELFNAILGRSDYCLDGYYDTTGAEVTALTYGYTDLLPTDPYYRTMMIATSTFDDQQRIDVARRRERNELDYGE